MKEILVIYYSQTGQLFDILKNITNSIEGSDFKIYYHNILPKDEFEFPWPQQDFYNTFPESFLQIPTELKDGDPELLNKKYDLVILGYQVWYLTPSIPINSFLKSDNAKKVLKDTPVVTIVACRNMWVQAQEKMKRLLTAAQAQLVGHIALVDRHINHISVITISHWMFSGKKDHYLGIFPRPGVSEKDIKEASRFGSPIKNALLKNNFSKLQSNLLKVDAVHINPFLVLTDKRGNLIFKKWADFITKKGNKVSPERLKWIGIFKYYLLFAIWVIAPIVFIVFLLTYIPKYNKIKREKAYYSSVSLKAY